LHLPWHDRLAGGVSFSTSIQPEEAAELGRLAAGRTVLEIGSAYGYSACVMAFAGAETVTAVDPHTWIPGSFEAMCANLEACGALGDGPAAEVLIVAKPSQAVMPELAAAGRRFGLIFIDGDHSETAVRHDIAQALTLLEPGGTIACHDYGEDCCCPGVRAAVNEMFPGGGTVTGTLMVVTP
jgi:predicted O-methyltransferase YrrM